MKLFWSSSVISEKLDKRVIKCKKPRVSINTGVSKKYTSLESYIFVLRTDKSLTFVLFVGQDLNLNFETSFSEL